ncbi:MAG: sigma-54 dependent transcriptional regulator [Nitrospiraceae bacterium]|nr:sigma-54 dependent transcriptional regulator [Nitrospiraceae bacterium]
MKQDILVIDDEQPILELFSKFLSRQGYAVEVAESLASARTALANREFHAVIIDQHLSDGKGIELIDEIRSSSPTAAIVMITGQAEVSLAVEAMQHGADNFLTKPVRLNDLAVFLKKSLEVVSLRRFEKISARLKQRGPLFFGTSKVMGEALEMARVAVENDGPVLITGETGVGKGVLARWIHENGGRNRAAFVEVSCPGFRGELLRSELYGHAKGSFTSAVHDQAGLLDAADGGTLFLDEIGDMELSIQAQFLKVIEDKTYRRMGETKLRRSDFRLICATNRDLPAEVSAGRFRKDLLFRLQVLPIRIPSLRERKEDVPELVRHFLAESNYQYRDLAPDVMQYLMSYSWPGNIREMKNLIERALLLSRGTKLTTQHFTGLWQQQSPMEEPRPEKKLNDLEQDAIQKALEQSGGNVVKAAKALGISQATLYRRMKSLRPQ